MILSPSFRPFNRYVSVDAAEVGTGDVERRSSVLLRTIKQRRNTAPTPQFAIDDQLQIEGRTPTERRVRWLDGNNRERPATVTSGHRHSLYPHIGYRGASPDNDNSSEDSGHSSEATMLVLPLASWERQASLAVDREIRRASVNTYSGGFDGGGIGIQPTRRPRNTRYSATSHQSWSPQTRRSRNQSSPLPSLLVTSPSLESADRLAKQDVFSVDRAQRHSIAGVTKSVEFAAEDEYLEEKDEVSIETGGGDRAMAERWPCRPCGILLSLLHTLIGVTLIIYDVATNHISHTPFAITAGIFFILCGLLAWIAGRRLDSATIKALLCFALISVGLALALAGESFARINELCNQLQVVHSGCASTETTVVTVLLCLAVVEVKVCVVTLLVTVRSLCNAYDIVDASSPYASLIDGRRPNTNPSPSTSNEVKVNLVGVLR